MLAARHFESLAEGGASACLGAAAAFAVFQGLAPVVGQASALASAGTAAVFAYWLSRRLLDAIPPPAGARAVRPTLPELLLDDEVAAARDGRVVRLFDPAAMPASRQSVAPSGPMADVPSAAPPDASQDLRDALNQLRRSLRQV